MRLLTIRIILFTVYSSKCLEGSVSIIGFKEADLGGGGRGGLRKSPMKKLIVFNHNHMYFTPTLV